MLLIGMGKWIDHGTKGTLLPSPCQRRTRRPWKLEREVGTGGIIEKRPGHNSKTAWESQDLCPVRSVAGLLLLLL